MSNEQETAARKLHEAVVLYNEFGGTPEWDRVEHTFWGLFGDYATEVEMKPKTDLPDSVIQDKVVEVFDLLGRAFSWTDHGGFNYWDDVRQNLKPLLPQGHSMPLIGSIERRPYQIRANAAQLAEVLSSAFYWDDVEPGFAYWNEVYSELLRIASEG